jgi:hypothetical protein
MKQPKRRRPPPKAIRRNEDIAYWTWLSEKVWYQGSVCHKRYPSWLGAPRPRADASICDPTIARETAELKEAALKGFISELRSGEFPTYIWYKAADGGLFTARITQRETGEYHGYPEWDDIFPNEFT